MSARTRGHPRQDSQASNSEIRGDEHGDTEHIDAM
jgi:hypothetical protein